MKIPFIDFSEQYASIKDNVFSGMKDVFERGAFIMGQEAKDFEKEFASYCGVEYGSGVNSGTDALYMALSALEVKPGDEVIIPAHTFIATALCITYTGAKPVIVDIEDQTYNMDPNKLEAAITEKTKAIIPVHLYGQAALMEEIEAIANKHNIPIVEDAAQAHGAAIGDRKVGNLGKIACFSFYPTKSLGGFGDGGMVVTNDQTINEKIAMLRDYGRKGRYDHKIKGFNSRLDTIQAVVLSEKLKHLDQWNDMRAKVADWYREELSDVEEVILPEVIGNRKHVYQTMAVIIKNRDEVLEKMKEKGVAVLIHYPIPIHLQSAYQDLNYKRGDFPVAERIGDEELSLPMFPHMTREQVKYVSDSLKECIQVSSKV